ncbi:OFA family MFS transporter [Dehalobacter sp. DCM]|uniref:L-lactate MFS transporter n=1 Tax=Dehalobacter sp. DCM TaxID=2907827 RepID=UPI003081DB48|nr:OFA family MFS transporter [Dehalobacter sp. DCM]
MKLESQRWVALVACILASMCAGLAYSWSVFLKPLISLFHWSATDTALSFTLLMFTGGVAAILVGKAQDKFQPRTVILVGGILFGSGLACIGFIQSLTQLYICVVVAGIGLGAVYPGGTMSNMVKFFPERSGLISGLVSAGYGIGPVVWAPVSVALLANYGIMTTMKMLGIVFLVIIVLLSRLVKTCPFGFKPDGWIPDHNKTKAKAATDKNWKQMLKDPLFWPLALTFTLGEITGMMTVGHASPMAQEILDISPAAAAAIVSILAVAMTLGKIGWGVISDKIGRYPVIILLVVLGGAGMAVLTGISSFGPFVAVTVVIGFCYGGFLSIMAPLTADLFGSNNLPINYGLMFMTVAIAAFVGPRLASNVVEANNGIYTEAFIIAALLNFIGLILYSVFLLLRKRRATAKTNSYEILTSQGTRYSESGTNVYADN